MNTLQESALQLSYGHFRWWFGVVEDIQDPKKIGRYRVRIVGYHTDDKQIQPTEHLFWAYPIMPVTSASISGIGQVPQLLNGSWVIGFFRDGDDCQEPFIFGSVGGIPIDKIPSKGFYDPEGVYPTELNVPDLTRLYRSEELDKTIIKDKQESRYEGKSWSEPKIPVTRNYPDCAVTSTKGGIIHEYDSTPDKIRIHEYHPSGTFKEIHNDGKRVIKISNDDYKIVAGNNYVKISGNVNVIIDGNADITVGGNVDMKTAGNVKHSIGGNYAVDVSGKGSINCGSTMSINASHISLND